jgi:hypothetical protein
VPLHAENSKPTPDHWLIEAAGPHRADQVLQSVTSSSPDGILLPSKSETGPIPSSPTRSSMEVPALRARSGREPVAHAGNRTTVRNKPLSWAANDCRWLDACGVPTSPTFGNGGR